MANVTIYTTPTCAYCKMAKEYFKSKNIEYTEHDVMKDVAKRDEMVKKSGQMGVPLIEIDGKMVIGFDKPKIEELLGSKWQISNDEWQIKLKAQMAEIWIFNFDID